MNITWASARIKELQAQLESILRVIANTVVYGASGQALREKVMGQRIPLPPGIPQRLRSDSFSSSSDAQDAAIPGQEVNGASEAISAGIRALDLLLQTPQTLPQTL